MKAFKKRRIPFLLSEWRSEVNRLELLATNLLYSPGKEKERTSLLPPLRSWQPFFIGRIGFEDARPIYRIIGYRREVFVVLRRRLRREERERRWNFAWASEIAFTAEISSAKPACSHPIRGTKIDIRYWTQKLALENVAKAAKKLKSLTLISHR